MGELNHSSIVTSVLDQTLDLAESEISDGGRTEIGAEGECGTLDVYHVM